MLIATAAHGGWDGFPFQDASNNWYSIQGYYPLNQILAAIAERDDCFGMRTQWDADIARIDVAFKGYTGTTNNVVTNGGFVYTNTYGTTTNITYTISTDTNENPTSDYETFSVTTEVVYVDGTGTGTNTTTTRFTQDMISKLHQMMFMNNVSKNMFTASVNTNMASADYTVGFDTYFATTNASGDYPSEFPHNTLGTVMHYKGVGLHVAATNDGWGFFTVPSYFTSVTNALLLTHQIEASNSVVMGRAVYDGSWTFADRSDFLYSDARYLADTNAHLVVTSFETNTPAMTVTVSGRTQPTGLVARTSGVAESVTMAGATAAMTNNWVDITNITVTGTAYTGDVVEVVFDGPITTYNIETRTGSPGFYTYHDVVRRLYFEQLNDFYHLLNACLWSSDRTQFTITADSMHESGNHVLHQGVSTSSWADAKSRAVAGTDVAITNNSSDMVSGTAGVYDSGTTTWTATIEHSDAYLQVTNIPTDVWHAIDMYLIGTKYLGVEEDVGVYPCEADSANSTFDDFGDGYTNHYFIAVATGPSGETNSVVAQSPTKFGGAGFTTNWCGDPASGATNRANGYRLEFNDMYLLRWDGSNGLAYK